MTAPTAEQLAKLPKWARDHIATLERRVVDEQRNAEQARLATNPAESDTIMEPYTDAPIGLGLGNAGRVRFLLGAVGDVRGWWIDACAHRDESTPYLLLMSSTRLEIKPQSGNTVQVRDVKFS